MNRIFISVFILLSCNGGGGKLDDKDYERTREGLEKQERRHPLNFLVVAGAEKKNFIGQTVVRGTIRNNASVCSYEDVRVKMLFYKAGALTENHEEVIDGVIAPNNELGFKSKYFTPRGTDSVALSVIDAKAVK